MIKDLYSKFISSSGVSTDTRNISPGNIFFALKGPHFDANKLAAKALDSGASFVVIDDPAYALGERYLLVDNVLQTLQQLANYHRNLFDIPVLGITGSNGKTTTKELIHRVLSRRFNVLATRGNLNNHIGVPLTLLRLSKETEIAIIEMGANKIGDIHELCEIAAPNHGIITNIGKAHIEGFGSYEGVIRGKSELYHWLIQNDGHAFINSADPVLANMAKRFKKPIFYPGQGDFFELELVAADPYVLCRTSDGKEFSTQLIGHYNFNNMAAALCIGKFFSVGQEESIAAVCSYVPENNRSQIIQRHSNTIIMDAYNANPTSMEAALKSLSNMRAGHKMAILGDMFELGENEAEEHAKIGDLAASLNLDQVFLCGERMKSAYCNRENFTYAKTRHELEKILKKCIFKDSVILIKGSRAMELEHVVNSIK